MAVIGLVHSHVWSQMKTMVSGDPARLVGVAETIPELVENARKNGVSPDLIYSDYRKMLDEKKPEFVWAFVENNRHLEIVEACAPRKIHVIFEKPLASTHKEALAIKALAAKHGIFVMTNYQMAWWASNYAAKKVLDAGSLGPAWRLRGIVGHGGPGNTGTGKYFFDWLTDPVKNGGGALVDFGCYNALWALWYLGRPVSVYATTNRLRPSEFPKVEDTSTLVLNYPNGIGLFEGSWDLPRSFQDLEVFTLQGSVYMTNGRVEVRKGRLAPESIEIEPLPKGQHAPIAYMVHCLETGTPPAGLVGLDINIQVVEILDAAKRSIRTGQAVKLSR